MPIKDFKCQACDAIAERLCKYETTSLPCKECGGDAFPLISAPAGIKFNGSGFYETDYKDKGR